MKHDPTPGRNRPIDGPARPESEWPPIPGGTLVTCQCGQTVEHEPWCDTIPKLQFHRPNFLQQIERGIRATGETPKGEAIRYEAREALRFLEETLQAMYSAYKRAERQIYDLTGEPHERVVIDDVDVTESAATREGRVSDLL